MNTSHGKSVGKYHMVIRVKYTTEDTLQEWKRCIIVDWIVDFRSRVFKIRFILHKDQHIHIKKIVVTSGAQDIRTKKGMGSRKKQGILQSESIFKVKYHLEKLEKLILVNQFHYDANATILASKLHQSPTFANHYSLK